MLFLIPTSQYITSFKLVLSLQLMKDVKFIELSAYALAAVQHGFLGKADEASRTIEKNILVATTNTSPSPNTVFLHYMFHAGGTTPLKVATVATSPKQELFNMVNSGALAGVSVDVLGLGEEWEGNPTKAKLYRAYVSKMASDQLVLLADAYDVLLSPDLQQVVTTYHQNWEGKILFGGEVRCWPDASFELLYPPSTSQFRYLNSGAYIGRADAILTMLDEILGYASLLVSDQRAFTRYMLLHPDQVSIDEDAEVFRSLHMHASVPGANLIYDYDRFIGTADNMTNFPLLVHGNGNDGNRYYAHVAKNMFEDDDRSLDFSRLPIEKIRENVRIASVRRSLSTSDLEGVILAANEMVSRGRFDEGAKTLYWGYVSTMSPSILTEYARWFAGEGCPFCTSPVKDPSLPKRLKVFFNPSGRYSMGGEDWREVTQYNIGVVYHWLREPDLSVDTYMDILGKGPFPEGALKSDKLQKEKEDITENTVLNIAAVATQDRPQLSNLRNSAQVQGLKVDILGMGDAYLGNSQKVSYFLDYVTNMTPSDLVLLVDAYDVLLFAGAKGLARRFSKFVGEHKIIFAGETSSYPDLGIAPLYGHEGSDVQVIPGMYKYLNSGVIMGRAKDLREMLITVASYRSLYLSDQRSFVRYYLTNRSSVMIDSDGSLFATLHGVTKSSVITKGPKISIGDVDEIAVVHGNAGGLGGKRYYEEIARAMISVAKSHNPGVTVEVQPPLYSSAVAYYQSGHISKAIEHFEMHLAGEPDHVESMYNLGVTYSEIEDWKSSRAWYQRCLSADESYLNCIVNLGVLLLERFKDSDTELVKGILLLRRAADLDVVRREQLLTYVEGVDKAQEDRK